MKFIRLLIIGFSFMLFIASCRPTPNHKHEPVNSTESGSNAAGNNDTATNHYDTLHPVQPNGMDTSGEQTGRMNNPAGHNNTTNQQNLDTGIHKMNKK